MGIESTLFYIFSGILVFAAAMVVIVKNPVIAALFLVLAFFTSAAVWMLLEAEFLALTLVLVYVGAVMVLFLFVVMMLDINVTPLREGFIKYLPFAILVAVVMALEIGLIVGPETFGLEQIAKPDPQGAEYSNTKALGAVLYTVYLYPFEIAAVILLVAIVAAIALTMRKRKAKEFLAPEDQVKVQRNDRVRLVKMASEKKK